MKKNRNLRLSIVLVLIVIIGAAIIGRLFLLQIKNRKLYEAQALGQQVAFSKVIGSRGQIFGVSSQETKGGSGSGQVRGFAINKDSWIISANPENIPDKAVFAEMLSEAIGQTQEKILLDLDSENSYVVLAKNISSVDLEKIKKLSLKGLSWQNDPERFYPQGGMASHTLGFLGGEGSGQYGLEGYYDDILAGKSGIQQERAGLDSIFSNFDRISLDGSDIYLTIDYNIQFQAETLLEQEKIKNDIDSGQIIVLKPDSGRIIALADFPNFDPNRYSKERDLEIFQNSAVQKLFEPGSIMKPFTMAAAMNEGKVSPDTVYTDTGVVNFGTKQIHNFADEIYGKQTMTQVLEKSINTGAVFAEQQIGKDSFLDYINKFGFTSKTGVDIQGEVSSRNDNIKSGIEMNLATASFGQGIELTPMQIARGFCALANGGRLIKPYIVEKIINGGDETYTRPEFSELILSQQTVSQINAMLVNVIEKGFNGAAKIQGYYMAGKTGTAQVPLKKGKGYETNKTIQSFAGYGPAFNPQFVILIKLDNPKVSVSALSAVPIFKQLAQFIVNYWKIPPDYDINVAQ